MAVEWLVPDGDGTVGGDSPWTSESSAPLFDSIDDYGSDGAGSHDSDTTYVLGFNKTDGSAFFTLDATPSDFEPEGITEVKIKVTARKSNAGVSGTADLMALYLQLFKSDEITVMTNEVAFSTNMGTSHVESELTMTLQGAYTKAEFDGMRVRLRQDYTIQGCADTIVQALVTAVGVKITWAPVPKLAQYLRRRKNRREEAII